MVWWVDKHKTDDEYKIYDKYAIQEDRIFQSVNVMFNFGEVFDDEYDIRALSKSGVNIFNIDYTVLDDNTSFHDIMKTITDSYKFPEMNSEPFHNPICVAVTMSIHKQVAIEKGVDIVILKNVLNTQEIIDFKESMKDFKLPVLVWISYCNMFANTVCDIIDLIRVSQGIILDNSSISEEHTYDVIDLCKKHRKSLFFFRPEIWEYDPSCAGSKRRLLVVASEVVNSRADGIVIAGCKKTIGQQTRVIRNIVEAMHLVEDGVDPDKEFEIFRKQLKTPQLASMAVAVAASQAAFKIGAAAIIVLTTSGNTTRLVSLAAPPCHILGITKREAAVKKMPLFRKVIPLMCDESRVSNWQEECRNRVLFGTEFAKREGLFGDGAKLVVLAPSVDGAGYCDTFYIITLPIRCDDEF